MTIAKTFLLTQFRASVLDPSDKTYETINHFIRNFVKTGTTKPSAKNNWIHQDILYGPKNEGGLNFSDARSFFLCPKISWVKRYTYASNLSNLWVIEKESSTLSQKMWSWRREKNSCREMCGKMSGVSKHFFESRQTFLGENKTYNH